MLDVAVARFGIYRRDLFADDSVDLVEHGVHRYPVAASDIEHLTADTRNTAGEQICFNGILNVGEIAGLQTISINGGPSPLKYGGDKERQDTTVLGRCILPWPKHVEVP